MWGSNELFIIFIFFLTIQSFHSAFKKLDIFGGSPLLLIGKRKSENILTKHYDAYKKRSKKLTS